MEDDGIEDPVGHGALAMDDDNDEKTERLALRPALVRPSKKSADAMLKRIARPEKRSPLFWWLVDRHNEIREVEAAGGLGIPWRQLCVDLAAEGITAAGGRPLNWETARKTWQRVRKEIVRVAEWRERELAEREARRAADPRRNMPSRFPKGEYGPPLSDVQPTRKAGQLVVAPSGARALLPANVRLTPEEQRARGLQLSTAEGVVVTRVSRVFKLPDTVEDFEFEENGMIRGRVGWSSALESKQQANIRSGRPINDDTAIMYEKIRMEIEKI